MQWNPNTVQGQSIQALLPAKVPVESHFNLASCQIQDPALKLNPEIPPGCGLKSNESYSESV